ncbi:Rieske 2Fe-2S domain-containing protein [Polaromonas sp. P1-6]|nr:Rieske 2Fe-2S domain-containing protein [Polaromonas sp. P1-6]
MLSHEDNQRYMNVEPGWPLHEMGKCYWVPYLRAETVEANGAPHKIELFGEKYVSFRASDGRLGFFDEQCPHRGASLHLAQKRRQRPDLHLSRMEIRCRRRVCRHAYGVEPGVLQTREAEVLSGS